MFTFFSTFFLEKHHRSLYLVVLSLQALFWHPNSNLVYAINVFDGVVGEKEHRVHQMDVEGRFVPHFWEKQLDKG